MPEPGATTIWPIERDLLTPYYAALTLHSIDLRQVCNELRQKAGLPELEEMQ